MPKNAYPVGSDLNTFLLAAGFSAAFIATLDQGAAGNLDLFALAGWEAFEREAGRRMLAVAGTRSFDRPRLSGGMIDLGDDLASGASSSVTDNGTALVLNTDYVLEPLDALGRGMPYSRARFWRRVWTLSQTLAPPLVVAGSWGYGTTIPDDAWIGMLAMAGVQLFPLIQQARSRGIVSWTEADMREEYGQKPLQGLLESWSMIAARACGGYWADGKYRTGRYTRVEVG